MPPCLKSWEQTKAKANDFRMEVAQRQPRVSICWSGLSPFLFPQTLTLSSPWILLSGTSWILFRTKIKHFKEETEASSNHLPPTVPGQEHGGEWWGALSEEGLQCSLPTSVTFKNQLLSKPRDSVNEFGIILGFK